nr:PREDICTED: cytochrome b-c1 complex subunit 8-like [Megachile rotundata]
MTLQFGDLPIRIRRIVYYTLAADDQRFWAKFLSHSLPNLFKRSVYNAIVMAPGCLMSVILMKWSKAEHRRAKRKNPALYEQNSK